MSTPVDGSGITLSDPPTKKLDELSRAEPSKRRLSPAPPVNHVRSKVLRPKEIAVNSMVASRMLSPLGPEVKKKRFALKPTEFAGEEDEEKPVPFQIGPSVAVDADRTELSKVRSKPNPKSPAESAPAGISLAKTERVRDSPMFRSPSGPRPEKSKVRFGAAEATEVAPIDSDAARAMITQVALKREEVGEKGIARAEIGIEQAPLIGAESFPEAAP